MSRLLRSRGVRLSAKDPRVIALLLALGFLLPALALIWLAARASENEQSAYDQALAQARARGALLLRREVEDRAAHWMTDVATTFGSSPDFLPVIDLLDSGLAEAVLVPPPASPPAGNIPPQLQAYLDEIPYIASTLGPIAAVAHIRSLLATDVPSTATGPGGRSIEAWLLLAGIDYSRQAGLPCDDLTAKLVNLLGRQPRRTHIPEGQRLLLLTRLLDVPADSGTVQRLLDAGDILAAWRTDVGPNGIAEGLTSSQSWVWLRPAGAAYTVVLSRPAFEQRMLERPPGGAAAARLLAPGELVRANPANSTTLDLDGPLKGWRLIVGSPTSAGGADISRTWIYGGLAFLVTGLSLLIVIVSIRLLRREISAAQLKNDLVATVSHELKTPVASVQLLVETLLDDPAASADKTREYLTLIHGENQRLRQIVERFLTFSRLERGGMRFDMQVTDLAAICRDAADAFRQRCDQQRCIFTVDCPQPIPVLGDQSALLTAIGNLLENAWKYSGEDKHIRLSTRLEPLPATRKARALHAGAVVEVEDNGPGIPLEDQDKLFEKFSQLDRRLNRHKGGVGLGLSIVASLAARHGGRVSVDSAPGRGSRFRIHLPAHEHAAHH